MLQRLEAIKEKLQALYDEGKTELSEIINDVEEAIGWRKVASVAPMPPPTTPYPGEPILAASPEGVLVDGAGVVSQDHIDAARAAAADGVQVITGTADECATGTAAASSDPAPTA